MRAMSKVVDITPQHEPLSIIREAEQEIIRSRDELNIVAAFVVLIDENGDLWRRAAGYQKRDVLWALMRCQNDLMNE